MIEFISQPWPWYISGMAIAGIMFLLVFFGKSFGFSSNFRAICAACGAGKYSSFFDYNWRGEIWNLVFLLGTVLGGFIAGNYLTASEGVQISTATIQDLGELRLSAPTGLQPTEIFDINQIATLPTIILVVLGGFLVGFGTRWAGGCTSGHAISGLSNLQLPSLIAVIGFFIGGLITTFLLLPLIF
ncbi:YeeE/YedE thiosulfate transporter family protein [soil metagenome]